MKKVELEGRRADVLALTLAPVGVQLSHPLPLWLSGRCLGTEMIILPIYTTHSI